ncbi:MAG: DUF4249 domain-containing protein [Bacteroidia bacterium]
MKQIKIFLIIASVLLTATSCQKVIQIDLNSASPKYVIEGGITNQLEAYQIRITKTKNFSDDNNFNGVKNAFVTITDNAGNLDTLNYTTNGYYKSIPKIGVEGRLFTLNVRVENETFSASSQMPFLVPMDTVYGTNFLGFGDTIKRVKVKYLDPASQENYYRFVLYINNNIKEKIIVGDDKLNNGLKVEKNLTYRNDDDKIKEGDSVTVEMQCIDKAVYNYFVTLNKTISQSSAAPTNPVSNISGGALGYFSAYTTQKRKVKIP